MKVVMIPHLDKISVAEGRERFGDDFDSSNPPLTDEARTTGAAELCQRLVAKFNVPAAIFLSPALRAVQTAQPAITQFGEHWTRGASPVICLNCLCQPDNGDKDPEHPDASENGLVIYGPRYGSPSTPKDVWWLKWFEDSRRIINAIIPMTYYSPIDHVRDEGTIWVFTHRPIVAAAVWSTDPLRGHREPKAGELSKLALDPQLKPWVVFDAATPAWTRMAA